MRALRTRGPRSPRSADSEQSSTCPLWEDESVLGVPHGGVVRTEIKQLDTAERFEECADGRAGPWRDDRAVGQRGRRRSGVKLAREVTVLVEAAVAVIGPQAVNTPAALGEELALAFQARERIPELRLEYWWMYDA